MTEFIENFPISDLHPADYNPRRIADESFAALRQSLKQFGVIKPVLLGADHTLIAGHQRTKALIANGEKFVPAIRLRAVSKKDEVRLNLYHNSIETDSCRIVCQPDILIPETYQWLDFRSFKIVERRSATIIGEICKLLLKYGAWGSTVVTEHGEVLLNADYVHACLNLRQPVLAYILPEAKAREMLPFLRRDYGEYHYDRINTANLNQTKCQMHRLRGKDAKRQNRSTLYEKLVIPQLEKTAPALDFGEGQGDYRKKLQAESYQICGYEPFLRLASQNKIAIDEIIKSLETLERAVSRHGLFAAVILDSVINSVTSLAFEHYVLLTCASLLRFDGSFYTATRLLHDKTTQKTFRGKHRKIEFLDKDNFSSIFREGLWTKQRFHTPESFEKLLAKYFAKVEIVIFPDRPHQVTARCDEPRKFSRPEVETALYEEFNPDYNGYRHDRHALLVEKIMLELERHDRIS